MSTVKVIQARVGETVEVQWVDSDGKRTVIRYTAPPKATRDARGDEHTFRATDTVKEDE